MNLQEIKAAVEAGKTVHRASPAYIVIKDKIGQWFVNCPATNAYWGLYRDDGTLTDGEDKFFIADQPAKEKATPKRTELKARLLTQLTGATIDQVGPGFEITVAGDWDLDSTVLCTRRQLRALAHELLRLANRRTKR